MRRFFNKLLRDFKTTGTARGGRRAPRRAPLQVEGLEDRLVMTSATQLHSTVLANAIAGGAGVAHLQPVVHLSSTPATTGNQTLYITPGPNNQLLQIRSDGNGQMDVYIGSFFAHYTISSIKAVNISLSGNNLVQIDDSNGMPFAPGTTISLTGTGSNYLTLGGSRAVNGNETYTAGTPSTLGSIQMDNLTFKFDSSVGWIGDYIPITGIFDVQTSGTNVQLYDGTDQFTGLGTGGGQLYFLNKPFVTLEENAPNAGVFLDSYTAPAGMQQFQIFMHGAGDTTTLDMTPSNVPTSVYTNVGQVANNASVNLWGNRAPVVIAGNASTQVNIGYPTGNGLSTTNGIQAAVTVYGAASLVVSDTASTLLPNAVSVTPSGVFGGSIISGNGLFANNGVSVYFINVGKFLVTWNSFQGIQSISENWWRPFDGQVHHAVFAGSGSHFNLPPSRISPQLAADLRIHASAHGTVVPAGTPQEILDLLFANEPTGEVAGNGLAHVAV
jgi:hypothetical protein